MRVLYVIDSLANGGAERSLAAMVPSYASHGLELEVAVFWERTGVHHDVAAQVPVHVVRDGGRAARVAAVRSLVRDRDPEVVHTTLFEADVTTRLAVPLRGPVVVTSLVSDSYGPAHFAAPGIRPWKLRAAQALDAATARRVRRFHAISTPVAQALRRRLQIDSRRIDVIPRGRRRADLGEPTRERKVRTRADLGVSADEPLVLAAARHEHPKGLDILLDAAPLLRNEIPGVRIIVAGRDGAATAGLRERSGAAGVELLGDRSDVPDLLVAADAVVLPSRWEGLGGVLIEALALGCPIVASDLPAVLEVVGDAARLVAVEDASGMARAVAQVLTDRRSTNLMAERGRARFEERFEIDGVVAAMAGFYERALVGS